MILLRRSVRSLQLLLNDFCQKVELDSVTTSAFCQARKKFRHTAFIELLEECTLAPYYEYDHKTYKGHRLVALDGSILRLPKSAELVRQFGTVESQNRFHTSEHCEAKTSIAYDLLNRLPLHGTLARARTHDSRLAESHLGALKTNDLVVADRAYASYPLFSKLKAQEIDFVIRCPRRRFSNGAGLFENGLTSSKLVELTPSGSLIGDESLALSIATRFIRVELPDGEIEVLITSLLDEERYPTESFKELYRLRWGIETYFHILKSRLSLEHFTGQSEESIRQDFYSTLYISALETICTEEAEEQLAAKDTLRKQKVNKVISFGVIKEYAFDIIYDRSLCEDQRHEKLTELFLQNPTLVRPERKNPRHKRNWASGYFQKNRKKHAF